MSLKKNDQPTVSPDRSVEEDLQRLQESGKNLGGKENPANPDPPETKKQQEEGLPERSDRRL
jgi:hypothetical protein